MDDNITMNETTQAINLFQHLINIEDLSTSRIYSLFADAQKFIDKGYHLSPQLTALNDQTLVNLFFEPSTRTRISFELAAKRLGVKVVNVHIPFSSSEKGESLLDTIYSLHAMNCNLFVIRHHEENLLVEISEQLSGNIHLINAGNGKRSHPSQALLDTFTILQYKKQFDNLSIAIIGDIAHSRVAHSQIAALKKLGATDIRAIAPNALLTDDLGISHYENLEEGINNADVIIVLRLQKERMAKDILASIDDYQLRYSLKPQHLSLAKPEAIVMHPGPVNRDVEIDSALLNHPQTVITQQITNGVAIRMAVISQLCHQKIID